MYKSKGQQYTNTMLYHCKHDASVLLITVLCSFT